MDEMSERAHCGATDSVISLGKLHRGQHGRLHVVVIWCGTASRRLYFKGAQFQRSQCLIAELVVVSLSLTLAFLDGAEFA